MLWVRLPLASYRVVGRNRVRPRARLGGWTRYAPSCQCGAGRRLPPGDLYGWKVKENVYDIKRWSGLQDRLCIYIDTFLLRRQH